MTQSISTRSFEDFIKNPDFLRQEIRNFPSPVLSSRKIRIWIVKKYGLYLDEHEERSLGRQISLILLQMHGEGEIAVYKRSSGHASGYSIKYVWKRRSEYIINKF